MSKLNQSTAFTVNNIIEPKFANGFVRVTICRDMFLKLIGKKPIISHISLIADENGVPMKEYVLDGVTLFSYEEKNQETGSYDTKFRMDYNEAVSRHVPVPGAEVSRTVDFSAVK